MSTLRLVNPQPMETLPKEGLAFIAVGVNCDWMNVAQVHLRMTVDGLEYDGWSYTATFEPETLNKESEDENKTE